MLSLLKFWNVIVGIGLACMCRPLIVEGGIAIALILWPSVVNETNRDRILPGMTQSDVEAILRHPPGNHALKQVQVFRAFRSGPFPTRGTKEWIDDGGAILVLFDEQGIVRWSMFRPVFTAEAPFIERNALPLAALFGLVLICGYSLWSWIRLQRDEFLSAFEDAFAGKLCRSLSCESWPMERQC